MLDFCMRARAKGYRTIVAPECIAKYKKKEEISSQTSHELLVSTWQDELKSGDPYYNMNLPLGLSNYMLPGVDGEFVYQPMKESSEDDISADS